MQRSTLLLIGLAALLPLLALAALLWRRYYRDDPANTVRRVVKNSAVPLALRLFVRALDMAFLLILQRTLDAPQIGPYDLAVLFVGIYLSTITEFGLGVLLTREAARDRSAAPRLFGATLALRLLIVLFGAAPAALLLLGGYGLLSSAGLVESITPQGQQAIWVLLLTLLPGAYSSAVTALYNAAERMEVPALIEVATAVISMAARLAVLWLGFGIIGLAWAAVGVSTITALIFFWLQRRDFFPPTLRWDWAELRLLGALALPLMLNNLLNTVFFRFDTFIVKAFGAGQGDFLVNQYNVAYKVISIATILTPVVTFAVFPTLSRRASGERAALAQAQNGTLQALLLLAFPIAAGISVLARELVLLVNGSKALDYGPVPVDVLAILAWFLPLSFANGLIQYVLIAVNRQHAITRAFLITALFNLCANLLAIPWFGLYAASAITILSEVVLMAVFVPLLREEGLAPPLLALAWRPAAAALLMGAAMLATKPLGGELGWLAAALVAPPVYVAALWLLGAFGAEERALARRVLGRS
jgi:O-antigen/teichoic acid export membrane protein